MRATVVLTACVALLLSRATGSVAGSFGLNHDWVSIHGDLANHRYVPLGQINLKTIAKLGAVWVSEPFADGATSRMTPIVHDSLMFFAAGARVYALDARSGSVLWVHKTESQRLGTQQGISDPVSAQTSGLAISRSWGLGLGVGLVFAGLVNGHVIALHEKTGEVAWDESVSEDPLPLARGVTCPQSQLRARDDAPPHARPQLPDLSGNPGRPPHGWFRRDPARATESQLPKHRNAYSRQVVKGRIVELG